MEDDPRDNRIEAWEGQVPLYPLRLPNMPAGTHCMIGTNYPAPEGKHVFLVQVEVPELLDVKNVRRVTRAVLQGLRANIEQNRVWNAAALMGGVDVPSNLPQSKPRGKAVHAFWMLQPEVPRPVLAFRSRYEDKDLLKAQFNTLWNERGRDEAIRNGWDKAAKVWWVWAEHAYPRLLGLFRKEGFKLVWIQREGFPPSPPVERV